MKYRFFTLICSLTISVATFAQASGGQISRKPNSSINNRSQSKVHYKKRETAINVATSDDGKKFKYETTQIVDLGLSSGTVWAGWNIGATTPEEIGDYYAWGEISPKYIYEWNTYFDTEKIIDERTTIEYKRYHVNGLMSIIGTEHDTAKMNWGDPWKMPTKAQIEELIRECEVHRVKLKGQDKYNFALFKGPNGKSIIFPLAGNKYKTELRTSWDQICWSGELRPYYSASSQNSLFAFYMGFNSFNNPIVRIYSEGFRCFGLNVRAVRSRKNW